MRLLDTQNFSLVEIADRDLEPQQGAATPKHRYGILSHRWEEDGEPTFEKYSFTRSSCPRKGIRKIEECCRVAQSQGLYLVWADTCCIDKRSSAELQEAINSMYRFYKQAETCFAYLRDVSVDTFDSGFIKSQWFTRGWTLQELLAPADLRFYDSDWNFLGDKKTLSHLISAATKIPEDLLVGKTQLQDYSVAQRMSWAAARTTTRIEDRAYSLLGIFDVNMPMLYGEGPKSFLRLQKKIIKTLDDESIFIWKGLRSDLPGLLASSPEAFATSGDVCRTRGRSEKSPYVMNSRGLYGRFQLIPYTLDTYLTVLSCARQASRDSNQLMGIFLRRLYEDDQYTRVSVLGEEVMEDAVAWLRQYGLHRQNFKRDISIRQAPLQLEDMNDASIERLQGFRLNEGLLRRDATSNMLFSVSGAWNSETRIVSSQPGLGNICHVGSIDIGPQEREIEVVRFGFDPHHCPIVYVTQRDVRYSREENEHGVLVENFQRASGVGRGDPSLLLGENFQDGLALAGGQWSKYIRLLDGTQGVLMNAKVDGFWALHIDRLDSPDVYLIKVVQQLGEERHHRVGRMRLCRVVIEGYLTWDLQLDELAPRSLC